MVTGKESVSDRAVEGK